MKLKILLMISSALLVCAILFFALSLPDGERLFAEQGCINCHRFKGKGGGIGPDLTDISKRRSGAAMREHIRNARLHNPRSPMPPFGHLSHREIEAIVKYLKE
jgi:mono/diheme cytochrome c family protein